MNFLTLIEAGEALADNLPKLLGLVKVVEQLVAEDPELGKRLDAAIAKAEAENKSRAVQHDLESELRQLGESDAPPKR